MCNFVPLPFSRGHGSTTNDWVQFLWFIGSAQQPAKLDHMGTNGTNAALNPAALPGGHPCRRGSR